MKRLTKAFLLLLCVALLAVGVVISVAAAEDNVATAADDALWQYVDSAGATQTAADMATAVTNAASGTTVTLLGDCTVDIAADSNGICNIDKSLTVDLGKNTLTIVQSSQYDYIQVTTSQPVVIKNGTIHAGANSTYHPDSSTYGYGHPIVRMAAAVNLTVEDVDTYSAGLAYSYGSNGASITVNGGDHFLLYLSKDNTGRSFIDSRANLTAEVNDARIVMSYLSSLASTISNKVTSGLEKHTEVTFNRCTCIQLDRNKTLICHGNENTYYYFNDCDLYGAFSPALHSWDSTASSNLDGKTSGAMTSANIVLGQGTRWNCDSASTVTPSLADGVVKYDYDTSTSYTFDAYQTVNTSLLNGDFAVSEKTVTYGYTAYYSTPSYRYTVGGEETTAPDADGIFNLWDAISAADAGTTVYVLNDVEFVGKTTNTAFITISKNITVDLGGNTMTLKMNAQNPIAIGSNVTVTFQNGTIVSYDARNNQSVHPVFRLDTTNPTLNLNNINSYTGGLIYSYCGQSAKVNITGGEHHLVLKSENGFNAFIHSRGGMTVNVSGASIYTARRALVAATSNKVTNGDYTSAYNFTDCTIIADSASTNLVTNANQNVTLSFTGCYLIGSIKPTVNSWDTDLGLGAMAASSVTLGEGTYVAQGSSFTDGLLTTPSGFALGEANESKSFTLNYASGTMYDGTFTTASSSKSYVFTQTVMSEEQASSNANFVVTVDGAESYISGTLAEAITAAQAGTVSTIRFLKDADLELSAPIVMKKAVTLDLDGYTLTVTQTTQQDGRFSLESQNLMTVKNGTIRVSNTANSNQATYPLFYLNWGNSKLDLIDLVVYSGPLVYNVASDNPKVNISGGEYHMVTNGAHTVGGVIESRANITVNAENAKFYLVTTRLLSSLHYKQTSGTKSSSFTFTNCDVYASSASALILEYVNTTTTVRLDGCNLFGTINPALNNFEVTYDSTASVATAENIILGNGTTIARGASFVAKPEDGYVMLADSSEYTFTATGISKTYTKEYVVASTSEAEYVITTNGTEIYVPAGYDFKQVLDMAADGSTIKLLADVEYELNSIIDISKQLTIDLNEHTLDIIQTLEKDIYFSLKSQKLLTVKNGSLTVTNTVTEGKAFPLFIPNWGGAQLTLENLKVTSGPLIYNTTADTPVVNIIGGEYNLIYSVSNTIGGLIESRDNIVVNASDAKIYLKGTTLLSSLSYNAATGDTFASTFTFTNCDIYRESVGSNLFGSINNYTHVRFNNCNLFGSMQPILHNWDLTGGNSANVGASASTAANVVLAAGTTVASGASITATVEDGYAEFYENTEYTYTSTGFTSAPYTRLYKISAASGAVFKLTFSGKEMYVDDSMTLAQAIKNADAGSILHVLTDLQIITTGEGDYYANINKALTIDLGGNTIYFSQSSKTESCINVSTTNGVTIQNGTFVWNINSAYVDRYTDLDATKDYSKTSFALFNVTVNNATVNLNDITAYGGTLVYSYQSTGTTVNVKGGEYHVYKSTDLIGGGIVEMRANATVNIYDAKINLDGGYLFTLTNYKESGTQKASSAYLSNCEIFAKGVNYNIVNFSSNAITMRFDGCMIYGSINPTVHDNDLNASASAPVAGSIVLGNGTYIMADATMLSGVVVAEDGRAIVEASKSYLSSFNEASGSIFDTDNPTFQISATSHSYTFTLVVGEPPLKTYYIKWYKEDGSTLIIEVPVLEGTVGVTAPTYTPGDNNGWYKVGFDGWTTTFGSTEKVDLATFVVTQSTSFYPAQTTDQTPTPYLSGAQYNLSFTGNVILNFYIPQTPHNVTNVIVKDANGNVISYRGINLVPGNVYYRLYEIATVDATQLNTNFVITVDFDVDGVTLHQTITLNPLKYAKRILEDSASSSPVYTSKTHTLIADMVRYSNALAYYSNGATVTEFDELLETYGSCCSDLPSTNSFGSYLTTIYELAGYVSSISFEVKDYEPKWVITLNTDKKITDVSITLDGYLPIEDPVTGVNFGELTYGVDTEKSVYDGNYLSVAYSESMPIYNIDRTITITVTTEDGTVKSAQYNLNTYFSHMSATGDTLTKAQDFLKAFRAFGISSSGYKYSDEIRKEDSAKFDFFECAHAPASSQTFTVANGRFCSDCQTYVFFYDDYINAGTWGGAVYDSRDAALAGKNDAYGAIDACHYYANKKKATGAAAGCSATAGGVYYLYEGDMNGNIDEITVQTDTDWAGAYIISDDQDFDITDASHSKRVFGIRGAGATAPDGTTYVTSGTNIVSKLTAAKTYNSGDIIVASGAKKIDFAPGIPMMILLTDKSQKRYIRYGDNADGGADQSEVILIDEFGNISNTTPVEWDYIYSADNFTATAYPVTDCPIKISGLDNDGNITAKFENICNNNITATSYNSSSRGLLVRRSNVTVEGIDHIFTEDDTNVTPRQAYNGFVYVWIANNTVVKDMLVYQHLGHYIKEEDNVTDWTNDNGGKNSLGSYEFSGADAVNTSWINCKSKNFFHEDGSVTYRGLFGTNRMKNMYLKDCLLNSFDAHSGAYNVTIEDSTFEHINFIGAGDIYMNNVTVYTTTSYRTVIILRQDYGATWNGDVTMKDIKVRYTTSDKPSAIDLVKAYYTNWYFGYTTHLPTNLTVDGIVTEGYSRTNDEWEFVDGTLVENVTERGSVPIAIYDTINSQFTKNYDYSTVNDDNADPRVCTSNVYISNYNGQIKYPDHPFFKNMKVYIDGVEKTDWYSERNFGGNCVTGDTLVTLADGTTKRIDQLEEGDMLLVWNFETGAVEAVPAGRVVNHGYADNTVVELIFDDGTTVKVVNGHQFFNVETNDFVTIDKNTVASFIGKSFVKRDADGYTTVKLVDFTVSEQYVEAWATVSAYHYNIFVNDMLSMDFRKEDIGVFRYFDIGEDMRFDVDKMQADIEEYGLYTYDDFADYLTYEQFVCFNVKYMKVAVGKGLCTYEKILVLIDRYLNV